jgi:glycosyltransferase involved in cell wall biosynthesis
MQAPELSAVIPLYNEAEVLGRTVARVCEELARTGRSFEVLCIDDGSTDDTAAQIGALAARDARIVPVSFSRNFGKEAAILAGLELARGQAVLFLDGDLQHPPELIPQLVARWEEGFEVVDAVKASRGRESWLRGRLTAFFYDVIGGAAGFDLAGASDFKLLDRQVVEALRRCPERNRFFRGLVAWAGFRVARVPFHVAERAGGRTKWSPAALVGYTLRSLVAFSPVPLRLTAWIGFLTVLAGAVVALHTLYMWWLGEALTGFTTVILLQYWLGGLILVSLGVLGYYVSHLYEEQKARPVFLVRAPRIQAPETEVGSPHQRAG